MVSPNKAIASVWGNMLGIKNLKGQDSQFSY